MLRAAIAAISLAAPAAAGDFVLGLPIDCSLGETCHVQNYFDRDPGPGIRDFRCGGLSYDGHDGTDFALPTLREMREGVNVLAAAPGVVKALRDGEPDRFYSEETAAGTAGRECGNGVVVSHDDGWETQYCHMKQGSVAVTTGQRVERGAVLGQVGLSGMTQFPHVHLSVRRDGQKIDPFDAEMTESCAAGEPDLWEQSPPYLPGGLLDAGFADAIPDYGDIRMGVAATEIKPGSPLVLFALGYGFKLGDVIELNVDGPAGRVVEQAMTLEKDQAQAFRAAGKKSPAGGWPTGRYLGTVRLTREGETLGEIRREISLR